MSELSDLNPEAPPLSGQPQGPDPIGDMRKLGANLAVSSKAAEKPPVPTEFTQKADGSVTIKGDRQLMEYYGKAGQFYRQAMGGMQQQVDRLKQQEDAARAQPAWVQLATALSANMAQQKDMPGWVKGLGQTAAQLNPRPEQLAAQRMGLMGEQADLAGKSANLEMSGMTREDARRKEARLADTAHAAQIAKTFNELGAAAQKGELTDVATTSQVLQDAGNEKDHADTQAKALVGISKEKQTLIAAASAATDKRTQDALTARAAESDKRMAVMLKGLSLKASDKSDADKAIETTAQSIAAGDLSSIKDISSFRGSERTRIYARAKEINPNFSVAETKRKIDMEQSFTVGKDGQNLQSFGTFLEHAGELSESLKGVAQSSSPALNKPINWIRKNAEGNPEYQRLLVAIEPVGKEFESFLLNQRALYVDDRKRIDVLMNGNSSPAQIMAALNQMGKTAKDRYTEMNHRYKRVMGQDIENPFGAEALAGAAKVGINLPQGKGPAGTSAAKYPWEK
jgi:hypothetical protein